MTGAPFPPSLLNTAEAQRHLAVFRSASDAAGSAFGWPGRVDINARLEQISTGVEISGVAVIVVAAVVATLVFLYSGLSTGDWRSAVRRYRADLGRGILLGLELLVAADIIGTVAVTPSLENLLVLALIVLIRTFLSFSLEVEIEGKWPWARAESLASRNPDESG
jgi:uncharacterized membrane protein